MKKRSEKVLNAPNTKQSRTFRALNPLPTDPTTVDSSQGVHEFTPLRGGNTESETSTGAAFQHAPCSAPVLKVTIQAASGNAIFLLTPPSKTDVALTPPPTSTACVLSRSPTSEKNKRSVCPIAGSIKANHLSRATQYFYPRGSCF